MTEKKLTISSLKREIERLKARAVVLEMEVERRDVIIREHIYGVVDAKMKIKQAMAILSGDDLYARQASAFRLGSRALDASGVTLDAPAVDELAQRGQPGCVNLGPLCGSQSDGAMLQYFGGGLWRPAKRLFKGVHFPIIGGTEMLYYHDISWYSKTCENTQDPPAAHQGQAFQSACCDGARGQSGVQLHPGYLMAHVKAGDRFGLLTAICALDGSGKRRWTCRCDCGEETIAEETKLRVGHKRSCGCLRRTGAHLLRMTAAAALANRKPIVGLRFGRLVILSEDDDSRVTCRCDCGSAVQVRRDNVVVGDTKSCGCLQRERAEVLADNRAKKQRRRAGFPEDVPMSSHSRMLRNQFRELSAQIKRRDNYTCALCQRRGVRLHVHHIERWSDNPEIRFDPTNLVTLCRDCHINRAHVGNVHKAPDAETAELLKSYVLPKHQWTCGCGAVHDRDVNAARNIAARGHARLAGGIPVL